MQRHSYECDSEPAIGSRRAPTANEMTSEFVPSQSYTLGCSPIFTVRPAHWEVITNTLLETGDNDGSTLNDTFDNCTVSAF